MESRYIRKDIAGSNPAPSALDPDLIGVDPIKLLRTSFAGFDRVDNYLKIGQTIFRMKLAVRAFIITLLFLASLLFLAKTPALAQTQTPLQPVTSYTTPNTNPDVPNNLHNWTQNVMIEVISAMTCQLAGVDPTNPSTKCLGIDQKTGKIGFVGNGGGAIGIMGNFIALTLTPPIHTSDYLAYVSRNFGITKPTYAANQTGFSSLSPLMGTWIVFRNIVYLLFVLIFLVIGIAIMLRVKIDPRTVMTVQNQIPKIIVGILLVTFSFAIAGILIDAMWIAIYLFINVLTSADPKMAADPAIAGNLTKNLNTSTLNFFNNTYDGGLLGVATGASGSIVQIIVNIFTGGQPTSSSSILDLLSNPIGGILAVLIGGIAGILAFFIISIAILWSMFKLWFSLLNAYIFILVDIVFAPFWIVSGLLPGGQSMGISAWLRDMLGNLAAFPTTIAMFLLGRILIDSFGTNSNAQGFLPPLIGTPIAGSSGVNVFGSFIALGIIFTTPHIVNITKAAFKAPKIDLGPIEQAVGVGAQSPGRLIGGAASSLTSPHYEQGAPGQPDQIVYSKSSIARVLRGFGLVK